MAVVLLGGGEHILAILLPGCSFARAWIDGRGIRTLPLHVERNRRCRQNRERARPSHDRGVPRLVGPQRGRERGERAAPRRARDRALRLPRRRRAVRRDRDRARGSRRPRASQARSSPQRLPPPADAGRAPLEDHRARGIGRDALLAAPRRHRRAPRQRQRDPPDPARQRRRRRAARGLGGLEDGRSRGRRGCPRARAPAQCRRALARLPGLVRALGRDVGDGRGQAHGDARRRRPRDGRAVRALEGRARRAARGPLRLRRRRARAVALRRCVLPGGAGRGRRRPRHVPRGRRSGRDHAGAPTTASGSRRAP